MKDFFAGFPEFAGNDFYVTGESYAGVYVPTLSARLVDDADFNFKVVIVKLTESNAGVSLITTPHGMFINITVHC